jgi:hypothetical protein
VLLGVTLFEIQHYTPIISSCLDDFEVINTCGCYPGEWGKDIKGYMPKLNISDLNLTNG